MEWILVGIIIPIYYVLYRIEHRLSKLETVIDLHLKEENHGHGRIRQKSEN